MINIYPFDIKFGRHRKPNAELSLKLYRVSEKRTKTKSKNLKERAL